MRYRADVETVRPLRSRKDNTPEAAALRELIRTGIAGGMYQPPATNWTVLIRTSDTVTFGHREGRIGIGDVIAVQRRGAGYTLKTSGGCGPIGYADGRQAQNLYSYQVVPGGLVVERMGGTCVGDTSPPPPITVEAIETPPQQWPCCWCPASASPCHRGLIVQVWES